MRVAEIARQPAPALHIDQDGVDRIVARAARFLLLAIEGARRVRAEIAVDLQLAFGLERLDRVADRVVVSGLSLSPAMSRRLRSATTRASFMPGRRILPSGTWTRGLSGFASAFGPVSSVPLRNSASLSLSALNSAGRIVAVENLAGIAAVAQLCQNARRIRRNQIVLDVGADAAEVDAPISAWRANVSADSVS
jgi:hypothetical protein